MGEGRLHQAIVIGAGPGGLATAACLRERGVGAVLIERSEDLANTWRSGYDRLSINTSSWFSYLPGQRFPSALGRWVSRDDLVAYYRAYANANCLRILTDTEVLRIERRARDWCLSTSRGSYFAASVVVATGRQHTPVIPRWPGRERFGAELIHAADYRNARPYKGRRVLVIGAGNSGIDIALDLAENGAATVWLSARRPPHLIAREVAGLPHDLFAVLTRRLPRRAADPGARLLRRLTLGDLGDFGLELPDDGAITRFEQEGRVPAIVGAAFLAALRTGSPAIVPGLVELLPSAALFADGSRLQIDALIAATGYRPDLGRLVGHLGLLDEFGAPLAHGASPHPSAPGLYFVGFQDPRSGQLRELRLQANRVAIAIARSSAGRPAPRPLPM